MLQCTSMHANVVVTCIGIGRYGGGLTFIQMNEFQVSSTPQDEVMDSAEKSYHAWIFSAQFSPLQIIICHQHLEGCISLMTGRLEWKTSKFLVCTQPVAEEFFRFEMMKNKVCLNTTEY